MRLMPSRPFHYYPLPLSLLSLGGSIDGGVSQNRLINSPINPTTRYRSGNAACHSGLSVVSRLASGLIFTFFFFFACVFNTFLAADSSVQPYTRHPPCTSNQ